MNKQQILQQARREIEIRRYAAEDKCEALLAQLRADDEWVQLESGLRQAEIDSVMLAGDKKLDAERKVKQYKTKQNQYLCKRNLSVADLSPKYSCDKCADTGYVDNTVCECLKREMRKQIVAESNVTNSAYTFANSTETDKRSLVVYEKAKKICHDGKKNILLLGNTGTGKTYLLTACANECIDLGKSVLFVTAYALNATLLDAHLSDTATNRALIDSLVDVDVLAIDDLGTEIVYKNVTAEYFFTVINERIARKKQTFISSNLSIAELRNRYDERMFSRLVDQNTTLVAPLDGKDKRFGK